MLACGCPEPGKNIILHIKMNGQINRSHIYQVTRALDRADEMQAELLIISMDSPGGSVFAGRKIIQLIAESPVPVAVHIRPTGAMASAMALAIYLSADIRAMARGTLIGMPDAASALPLGPHNGRRTSPLEKQMEALFFSITAKNHIRKVIAEYLWKGNLSYTPEQALRNGLIHIIVDDSESLVNKIGSLNFISNKVATREIRTENARIVYLTTPFYIKAYSFITDFNNFQTIVSITAILLVFTVILQTLFIILKIKNIR